MQDLLEHCSCLLGCSSTQHRSVSFTTCNQCMNSLAMEASWQHGFFPLLQDYAWRNNLQFNPNEKKGGYSYTDVVLMPMANAVNRVIK